MRLNKRENDLYAALIGFYVFCEVLPRIEKEPTARTINILLWPTGPLPIPSFPNQKRVSLPLNKKKGCMDQSKVRAGPGPGPLQAPAV